MKPLILSLALLASLAPLPLWAQDPVFTFEESDPAMAEAIASARSTLPLFLDHALDAQDNSVPGALVKVAMPTETGSDMSVEHIWVTPFARREDGSFTGLLANEPADLGSLVQGDQVDFTDEMISDWHIDAPSGKYWGSFTSRVMHASGAFGDTPFEQIFEADPVPVDWK